MGQRRPERGRVTPVPPSRSLVRRRVRAIFLTNREVVPSEAGAHGVTRPTLGRLILSKP